MARSQHEATMAALIGKVAMAVDVIEDAQSLSTAVCDALERLARTLSDMCHLSTTAYTSGVVSTTEHELLVQSCRAVEAAAVNGQKETQPSSKRMCLDLTSLPEERIVGTKGKGRPPFNPVVEHMEYLQAMGYTYDAMASLYGRSTKTIQRWCRTQGTGKRSRQQASDAELRHCVQQLTAGIGASWGWRMVHGHVISTGLKATTRRVRQMLATINPHATVIRQQQLIQRRVYRVSGPNALWHVDGHHKLAPWGMYIHGAIDGGTRYILYTSIADNNTAKQAFEPYLAACCRHQGCSRVRLDAGVENVLIASYQERVRGPNRGSALIGPSTGNQPVERMWLDVKLKVVNRFRALFHRLQEELHVWRDSSTLDRHCLLHVFLPVIQECLEVFRHAWNHHAIPGKGTPAHTYEPCCRWDMLDDDDWKMLEEAQFTRQVSTELPVEMSFDQRGGEGQVAGDVVRAGDIAQFTIDDAAALREQALQDTGPVTPSSTDSVLVQFYNNYRRLVQARTTSEQWPTWVGRGRLHGQRRQIQALAIENAALRARLANA